MSSANRKSHISNRKWEWLPDMDLNHDKQIQSLLCYRYTIGQTSVLTIGVWPAESRLGKGIVVGALERESVRACCGPRACARPALTLQRPNAPTLSRFDATTL
jgi:hypothetical protein